MLMRRLMTPCLIAGSVAAAPALLADDHGTCDLGIMDPFNPKWVEQYGTVCDIARKVETTPPMRIDPLNGIPFERLRTMPSATNGPLTFTAKVRNEDGTLEPKTVTLNDPVVIVSWVFTTDGGPSADNCGTPWQSFEMLQEYVANDCDGALNSWFTLNCDATNYIDEVRGIRRQCLNMETGTSGCNDSIAIGLPAVGVPYAFGSMGSGKEYDPYFDAATDYGFAWYEEFVIVAVADRTSLVRPSLNPTVAPNSEDRFTANGEPIWDETNQRYRRPEKGDALYPAVRDKLQNFVGWYMDCNGVLNEYRGFDEYWDWQSLWQAHSWDGCPASPDHPYDQFPYSGLGLTLDWTTNYDVKTDTVWTPETSEPLPQELYALSEFLHVGETPIYFIEGFEGAQYLGTPEPGQVAWYDSCDSDLNLDGQVNGADLSILLEYWDVEEPSGTNRTNLCVNSGKRTPRVGGAALADLLNNWGECSTWPFAFEELSPVCP